MNTPAVTQVGIAPVVRIFCTAIVVLHTVIVQDLQAIPLVLAVLVVVSTFPLASTTRGSLLAEGALLAMIASVALETSPQVSAVLIIAPVIAGVRRGFAHAGQVLAVETLCYALAVQQLYGWRGLETLSSGLTWLYAAIGLAMVSGFMHTVRQTTVATPYRDARALIVELLTLSEQLEYGLHPRGLANRILHRVHDELPIENTRLYAVSPSGDLTPLVTHAVEPHGEMSLHEDLATASIDRGPLTSEHFIALPLRTDASVVAVVTGELSPGALQQQRDILPLLEELGRDLATTALQLDTALLFARASESATAAERHRLGREMHDGVAQDIASMGYLVDALGAQDLTPEQTQVVTQLRATMTSVLGEVRRSISVLRSDSDSPSLGSALSAAARGLADTSGVEITMSVNERNLRLDPAVEAELIRIASEAMTNAARHSGSPLIQVTCHVDPPNAHIEIQDHGTGMTTPRSGSHGLTIMHERAKLIGAAIDIDSSTAGVTVRISLGYPDHGDPADATKEALA